MTISGYRIKKAREAKALYEKEALEKKIAPIMGEIQSNSRKLHKTVKLKVSQHYDMAVNELLETDPRDNAGFDNDFIAPMCPEGEPRSIAGEKAGFKEFLKILKSKYGYTLEIETGGQRVICFAISHSVRGFDFSRPESWMAAFNRLNGLSLFAPGEVSFNAGDITEVEPPPAPEQPATKTLADIENIDTSTREGNKLAIDIAKNDLWSREAKPVFQAWVTSLYENFSFVPDEAQQKTVIDFFLKRNLSFLQKKNYDTARRWMCRQGLWDANRMLTDADKAADEIERTDLTRLDYSGQVALKTKLRSLQPIHGKMVATS